MNTNEVNQTSQINASHATFGPGAIVTGAVNHITTTTAPQAFKVGREDTRFLDVIARVLATRLTDLQIQAVAALLALLGIGGAFAWDKVSYPTSVFIGAVVLLCGGVLLMAAVRHKQSRQCPACHAQFALVEGRGAQAVDVEARDGTHRTTLRQYSCSKCGHVLDRETSEVLADDH